MKKKDKNLFYAKDLNDLLAVHSDQPRLYAEIVEILRKNGMQFSKGKSATEILKLFRL